MTDGLKSHRKELVVLVPPIEDTHLHKVHQYWIVDFTPSILKLFPSTNDITPNLIIVPTLTQSIIVPTMTIKCLFTWEDTTITPSL